MLLRIRIKELEWEPIRAHVICDDSNDPCMSLLASCHSSKLLWRSIMDSSLIRIMDTRFLAIDLSEPVHTTKWVHFNRQDLDSTLLINQNVVDIYRVVLAYQHIYHGKCLTNLEHYQPKFNLSKRNLLQLLVFNVLSQSYPIEIFMNNTELLLINSEDVLSVQK